MTESFKTEMTDGPMVFFTTSSSNDSRNSVEKFTLDLDQLPYIF